MSWLPNWSLPQKNFELFSELDRYDSIFDKPIPVVKEGDGLYRLYDFHYSPALRWGDLILAEEDGKYLNIIKRVERADHTFTNGEGITDKPHAGILLDAIMDAGGFWAADAFIAVRGIDVAIPPAFSIEDWESENQKLINDKGRTSTKWGSFIDKVALKHKLLSESKLKPQFLKKF